MEYILFIVIGSTGIIAQVLCARELLVNFYGNELTIGIILANWILLESVGVLTTSRAAPKVNSKTALLVSLQLLSALSLPLSLYFARTCKVVMGIPSGEAVGVVSVFFISLLALAPMSITHGALFSAACLWFKNRRKSAADSAGIVYAWETGGTLLGGIIASSLIIPRMNVFSAAVAITLVNLGLCFWLFRTLSWVLRGIIAALFAGTVALMVLGNPGYLNQESILLQWQHLDVISYRNTVYGNIVVTECDAQRTIFTNGVPGIVLPYPDKAFSEEFVHFPLLVHNAPQDICALSGAAGGILTELLKYKSLKRIDYAELDPVIFQVLEEFPSEMTKAELADKRVRLIPRDARLFLQTTPLTYDAVLLGVNKPHDLSTNRLFTQEFFTVVSRHLKSGGVLALTLPGSTTYLSRELLALNLSVYRALRAVFGYIRIIPGDYTMYIAGHDPQVISLDARTHFLRLNEREIKSDLLTEQYLEYRLQRGREKWFVEALNTASARTNRDLSPAALFNYLVFWNKEFSPSVAGAFAAIGRLRLGGALLIVILLGLMAAIGNKAVRARGRQRAIVVAIGTSGFYGMMISLVLMFLYQTLFGYVYYRLGLCISLFMAGICLGSMVMNFVLERRRLSYKALILVEAGIAGSVGVLILAFTLGYAGISAPVFAVLFFLSGILPGLEFPLAGFLYSRDQPENSERSAGVLYGADLLGGWLAGLLGSIVLVPVLGLLETLIVVLAVKAMSLLNCALANRNSRN